MRRAVRRSLVAVHTLLAVDDGAFVSLLDPPEFAAAAVAGCSNDGTFPVLIGDGVAAQPTVMLSSPIILYDHPAVAPESQGDFCDATEIDEILALRVLTLTDDEKAEARGTDRRAAAIVDRCDDMPPEVWERLHGAVRSLRPARRARRRDALARLPLPWWDPGVDGAVDPWTDTIVDRRGRGRQGHQVRLRPSRRADAHDLFLAGRSATVAGVFHDVDGDEHVAVTLDDDPATEVLAGSGRYLYFHPDEIEVCASQVKRAGRRHRQHLLRRRRLRRRGGAAAWPAASCPTACGWRTTASAACTSPTSCSTATTPSCSSTRCRWVRRAGTVAVLEPTCPTPGAVGATRPARWTRTR